MPPRLLIGLIIATACAMPFVGQTGSAPAVLTGVSTSQPIDPNVFGSNDGMLALNGTPTKGLSVERPAGVGLDRFEINEGTTTVLTPQMDAQIEFAASNDLRVYPILGIPFSRKGADYIQDAVIVEQYVNEFAKRFGRGGTFWQEHACPGTQCLPYLPITQYEIGNEPNLPTSDPTRQPLLFGDGTNLHYIDSVGNPLGYQYGYVYKHARIALHAVDPNAVAVLGGLSDGPLVPQLLTLTPQFLATMNAGPIDAIGFHPYDFYTSLLESRTVWLRDWLNTNGYASVPIELNEFGAYWAQYGGISGSGQWGMVASDYIHWALCEQPSLNVVNVQPEWWGGKNRADANPIYPMAHDDGTLSPFGTEYLNLVHVLTTQGCGGSGWQAATTAANSAPATTPVAVQWSGCTNLYWQGLVHNLVEQTVCPSSSTAPHSMPNTAGLVYSTPAVETYAGHQSVYWRGPQQQLMILWGSGTTWYGPSELMGTRGDVTSSPTVVNYGGNEDIFWKGGDQGLHELSFNGTTQTFGEVSEVPGTVAAGPANVSMASAPAALKFGLTEDVYWKGSDNNLYGVSYDGTWYELPEQLTTQGNMASAPTVDTYNDLPRIYFTNATGGISEKAFDLMAWSETTVPNSVGLFADGQSAFLIGTTEELLGVNAAGSIVTKQRLH